MKSFFKSSIIVALGTLVSRLSGLARELLLAWFFGATIMADVINVAFKLPNLFRRIFAEGALSIVFIPIFNSLEDKKSKQEFASQTFFWLMISLIIFTIAFEYFMPQIVALIAPGFLMEEEIFITTIALCRITIIYLLFVSSCALIGGILNSLDKFGAFAFNQVILNVVLIAFTLAIYYLNILDVAYAFCLGLVLGGVMQLIIIYKIMIDTDFKLFWPSNLYSIELKTLMVRMIPALGSAGVMQINLFISQIIASFIVGAISVLNFAERIYQFPLSILGITFSTVLLPELSKLNKFEFTKQSYNVQNNVIKLSLILSLPCAIGIMIFSQEFINLIYERGAFDSIATQKVSSVLFWFAFGLPAFILVKIFTTILYAKGKTLISFKITLYSIVANVVLNIIFMHYLGEIGIALGSSISAWLHVVLLLYFTLKHEYYNNAIENSYWLKLFGLNFITIIILGYVNKHLVLYYYSWGCITKIIYILIIISFTMIFYFLAAAKLKMAKFNFISQ